MALLDESPEAYFEGLERFVPPSGSMPELDVLLAVSRLDITLCFRDGSPATQLGGLTTYFVESLLVWVVCLKLAIVLSSGWMTSNRD